MTSFLPTNKPTLQTTTKLLKLRSILDQIGQGSYSYSVLVKQYPLHTLDEQTANELIETFESIIKTVENAIKQNYE